MRQATYIAFVIATIAAKIAFCQIEVTQKPVTYFSAKSATIEDDAGGVLIFAEQLSTESQQAMMLEIVSGSPKWASVHDRAKPFPPVIVPEWKPGKFLIKGRPGQVFYVYLGGSADQVPTWIEVSIGGVAPDLPPPVNPPPTNPPIADLEELSRSLAVKLGDPDTAKAIAASLNKALDDITAQCARGQCPTLAGAKQIAVYAIEGTLAVRKDPFRADWLGGWRKPISEAVAAKNPVQVSAYVLLMRSVASGLAKVQ